MTENTRGEQRFAGITYSQLAWWTGLKLSTVQSYGSHGFIPKENMVATLQWVARRCHERKRPGPWDQYLSQQDRFSREAGFWCYRDYLKSDLWQEIRSRILPCKCRRCDADAECVHHHRYTRENMAGDDIKHLVPLCTPCHLKSHHPDSQDIDNAEPPDTQSNETTTEQPAPSQDTPPKALTSHLTHPPSCRCHSCYLAAKAAKA